MYKKIKKLKVSAPRKNYLIPLLKHWVKKLSYFETG